MPMPTPRATVSSVLYSPAAAVLDMLGGDVVASGGLDFIKLQLGQVIVAAVRTALSLLVMVLRVDDSETWIRPTRLGAMGAPDSCAVAPSMLSQQAVFTV